jgi:DNA (cytosine-5)-methyltransferase 1
MTFSFIDLFAGIGGFHSALTKLGGNAVYASEIDRQAARIYENNWGLVPAGDITMAANDENMLVPEHDVLTGGFPCQPFSKSGRQKGMDETRGTLFWNIAKIIEARKPSLIILENVRNLAGPRHAHEWEVIIQTLRDLGYLVSSKPFVVSPHRIHPMFGGRPQVRERIFIAATFVGVKNEVSQKEPEPLDLSSVMANWAPKDWELAKDLPLEVRDQGDHGHLALNEMEIRWIDAWNDFVVELNKSVPGGPPKFPIWVDSWIAGSTQTLEADIPHWKRQILLKNQTFYRENKQLLDSWLARWDHLSDFPASRRKFEWQAQDAASLWECIMHFRPSGIRAKRPTYVPALVAITQTTILGPQRRRLSVREAARLQGLPEGFSFDGQPLAASYKQLGNGVNVSVVYHVLRALVARDAEHLGDKPQLLKTIRASGLNPDS